MLQKILAKAAYLAATVAALLPASGYAGYEYNLPEPAAGITQEIYDLHMLAAYVGIVIMVIVTAIIVYTLYYHRKSRGFEADQKFHEGWFGRWSWVLVPIVVLGIDMSIAGPATQTLNKIETYDPADVTVKVTGSQWKWTYEYMDSGVKIVSNLNRDLTPEDEHFLRDVDNPLVLPTDRRIRFLHTAADVLHAWWVPAIAYKKDSIPGYINETWTVIDKEGTYRGQCAENCGTGHAYMPIVVNVVSGEEFDKFISDQTVLMAAAAAEASADKVWPMEDLMARGEEVYNKNCVACHMANGEGIPNVFPGLKGSKIATEDLPAHIDIVLNGKQGTAMAAWKDQLNDLELAALITYERNAWGNDTGETVQPADIKAAR
jgi:cytochrome c oxidase subunit 2